MLSQSVHHRDNSSKRAHRLPDLKKKLQATNAVKGRLAVFDHLNQSGALAVLRNILERC